MTRAIARTDPPLLGFYAKQLRVGGIVVRSHADVPDAALDEGARRIDRLLARCPAIRANLEAAGAELHVIGRDQHASDLPMYRHYKGQKFDGERTFDERGRGYGGLHACCDEDGLLGLSSQRHKDGRDICTHEFAHTVLSFGLDGPLRDAVRARWSAALAEGRWVGAYAATNAHEFFAELTMWFTGSRGDYGSLDPRPRKGRTWLCAYDRASYELLRDLYTGRRAPGPIVWDELAPAAADRSTEAKHATEVVFLNRTAGEVRLFWLDYQGGRMPYGAVPAGGLRSQATYATHPWVAVEADGTELGPYVPGGNPGRIVLA